MCVSNKQCQNRNQSNRLLADEIDWFDFDRAVARQRRKRMFSEWHCGHGTISANTMSQAAVKQTFGECARSMMEQFINR